MSARPSAFRLAPALLVSLAMTCACGSQPSSGIGSGVLLIAIDGLRADHLGVYGYDRDTSPMLAALAKEGVRFEEVYASAPLLIPAHVALLTGSEPGLARRFFFPPSAAPAEAPETDVREVKIEGLAERRWHVSERGAHVAVEFLAAGYATAAFVDHEHLDRGLGLAQGFQHYEFLDSEDAERWERGQTSRIVEHFLQWLRALPAGRPWFAYLHLHQLERCWSDPGVYAQGTFQPRPERSEVPPVASTDSVFFAVPRSRWRGGPRTLGQYEAVYDNAIQGIDDEIAHLCASLRHLGRFESTSLHVVGAFGMQFGEAGLYLTAGRYSQADLGVPWIFRPKGALSAARGRSVPGLVSTLDVAPTLLGLEGLEVPPMMSGFSKAAVTLERDAPVVGREFVHASCGLQGGSLVVGANHVLEQLVPESAEEMRLRRSWLGERAEFEKRFGFSFYERSRLSAPPLEAELPPRAESEFNRFKEEVFRWSIETSEARHLLQVAPGRDALSEEALTRFRAEGHARASE